MTLALPVAVTLVAFAVLGGALLISDALDRIAEAFSEPDDNAETPDDA